MSTQKNHSTWRFLTTRHVKRSAAKAVVLTTALMMALFSSAFGPQMARAFAETPACQAGDREYTVLDGDTLDSIATSNGMTWQDLAAYNSIPNADLIYVNQQICIPNQTQTVDEANPDSQFAPTQQAAMASVRGAKGASDPFPYGQCTYWASLRYKQVHGFYVPWSTNANAWQWVARARDFHWSVSSKPTVGSIIVLQPYVQLASGLGHVAFVEKVLPNGHVTASNMNWGGHGAQVVDVDFFPAPGVSFITA